MKQKLEAYIRRLNSTAAAHYIMYQIAVPNTRESLASFTLWAAYEMVAADLQDIVEES